MPLMSDVFSGANEDVFTARSGYWFSNYSCCCTRRMCLQRIGNKPKMKKLLRKKGRACPKKYFVARSFVLLVDQVANL
jgi:hypothetical protein